MRRQMGEQRIAFEQRLALMKAQIEEQMGVMTQAIDNVKRDAGNAQQNEEQLKGSSSKLRGVKSSPVWPLSRRLMRKCGTR
eukprot:3551110-Alexandrium_andersonii.AAC.2